MALVELSPASCEAHLNSSNEISIAVCQSSTSTVLAGSPRAIDDLLATLEVEGVYARRIKVDVASHSSQMGPLRADLLRELHGLSPQPASIPIISTVRAGVIDGAEMSAEYWADNLRETVRFADAVTVAIESGHRCFVEVGPHPLLLPAIESMLPATGDAAALATLVRDKPAIPAMLSTAAELFVRGARIDWTRLTPRGRAVSLPTYPWQRSRHWVATRVEPTSESTGPSNGSDPTNPIVGRQLPSLAHAPADLTWQATLHPEKLPLTVACGFEATPVLGSDVFVEMVHEAISTFDDRAQTVEAIEFAEPIIVGTKPAGQVQLHLHREDASVRCMLFARGDSADPWVRHATATARARTSALAPIVGLDELRRRCTIPLPNRDWAHTVDRRNPDCGSTIERIWRGDAVFLAEIAIQPPRWGSGRSDVLRVAVDLTNAALQTDYTAQSAIITRVARLDVDPRHAPRMWMALHQRGGGLVDIEVLADDGSVAATATDVATAPFDIDTNALRAGHDRLERWTHCLKWHRHQPRGRIPAPGARPICVIGGGPLGEALRTRLGSLGRTSPVLDVTVPPTSGDVVDLSALCMTKVFDACQSTLQTIERASTGSDIGLWFVTRGAQSIAGEAPIVAQSAVWALAQSHALESPEQHRGLIDLDPACTDVQADASAIATALLDATAEDRAAIRDGQWWAPRIVTASTLADHAPFVPDADATYLVTGGLGRLGRLCARHLVDLGARALVLTSRSGPPATEDPDIQALRESGAAVDIVEADVADSDSMSRLLNGLDRRLDGVIHCAGVVTTGALVSGGWSERLQTALRAKVGGAQILDALTRDDAPRIFVAFSSVVGVWGGAQQSAYAAANAALDAVMLRRSVDGLPASTIDWGWWRDGAAASPSEVQRIRAMGLRPMETGVALRGLARFGFGNRRRTIIADVCWADLAASYAPHQPRPLFDTLVKRELAVSDGGATPLAELSPTAAADRVHAIVNEALARVLGLAGDATVDPDRGFSDMGLDSTMAAQLMATISRKTQLRLPTLTAFRHPTVDALCQHVLDVAGIEYRAEAVLDDELTEAELEAMLAEKLSQL